MDYFHNVFIYFFKLENVGYLDFQCMDKSDERIQKKKEKKIPYVFQRLM